MIILRATRHNWAGLLRFGSFAAVMLQPSSGTAPPGGTLCCAAGALARKRCTHYFKLDSPRRLTPFQQPHPEVPLPVFRVSMSIHLCPAVGYVLSDKVGLCLVTIPPCRMPFGCTIARPATPNKMHVPPNSSLRCTRSRPFVVEHKGCLPCKVR